MISDFHSINCPSFREFNWCKFRTKWIFLFESICIFPFWFYVDWIDFFESNSGRIQPPDLKIRISIKQKKCLLKIRWFHANFNNNFEQGHRFITTNWQWDEGRRRKRVKISEQSEWDHPVRKWTKKFIIFQIIFFSFVLLWICSFPLLIFFSLSLSISDLRSKANDFVAKSVYYLPFIVLQSSNNK